MVEDNSGECYIPRMSEERRMELRKRFPAYFWDEHLPTGVAVTVNTLEGSAEAVGRAIVAALRESNDRRS